MGPSRHERKFLISELSHRDIEQVVRSHPAVFRSIYHPRHINNIYFDTPGMTNYWDGVDGASNRLKVRIRWYGELFGVIENPVLELKFKREVLVSKEAVSLECFALARRVDLRSVSNVLRHAALPAHVRRHVFGLQPVLVNRYLRSYYLSADSTCRLTVDNQLSWYSARPRNNTFLCKEVDRQSVIVELKYSPDDAETATRIAGLFPFRMGRCSKYVSGIQRLLGHRYSQ